MLLKITEKQNHVFTIKLPIPPTLNFNKTPILTKNRPFPDGKLSSHFQHILNTHFFWKQQNILSPFPHQKITVAWPGNSFSSTFCLQEKYVSQPCNALMELRSGQTVKKGVPYRTVVLNKIKYYPFWSHNTFHKDFYMTYSIKF